MIAAYTFFQTIAATLSPTLISFLASYFNAPSNPAIYGKILTGCAAVGYLGSIPFWLLAGRSYRNEMLKKRAQNAI